MTPNRKASSADGYGSISVNFEFRQNPKVISHDFEGTAYIADLDKNEVSILNKTASAIWEKAAKGTTIKDATAEIAKKFSVSVTTAEADATMFINSYLNKGLFIPVKSPLN